MVTAGNFEKQQTKETKTVDPQIKRKRGRPRNMTLPEPEGNETDDLKKL